MSDAARDSLPETLAQLVDALGLADALFVVEHLGGARIYFPSNARPTEDHPIVKAVGTAIATRLYSAFPGEELDIPRAVAYLRTLRDREIRAATDATLNELALKFRLTRRWIINIRASAPLPEQQSLF